MAWWQFLLYSLWVGVLVCVSISWLGSMLRDTICMARDAGLLLIARWFKEQEDFLARLGTNERRQFDRMQN